MSMDFPANPTLGQTYTNTEGTTYSWDGQSWVIGFGAATDSDLRYVGGIINQIRILLQDTDAGSGGYRYSTASIVMALNQCLLDLFRMRPDLFMVKGFVPTQFVASDMTAEIGIEPQYVPPVIYYAVGLVQARDDEQSQDARAMGFLRIFQQTVINGALA